MSTANRFGLVSLLMLVAASVIAAGAADAAAPFHQRARAEARVLPLAPLGDRQIVVDGKLADWGDLRQDGFALHQLLDHTIPDFHASWKAAWEAAATDGALLKLLAGPDALYIAILVADNAVISPAEKRLDGDVVDLYLDLRPLTGPGPVAGHAKYTEGVYQLVFGPPADGQALHVLQPENDVLTGWRPDQKVGRLGAFEAAGSLVPGGYAIELRLPLASFPHGPPADRLASPFGFEVMIADLDVERPKGQPARLYYSCSGYSGGRDYFKSPAMFACADPAAHSALPLSRLRRNPLTTAPGGDEAEGWFATAAEEKDLLGAYAAAARAVGGGAAAPAATAAATAAETAPPAFTSYPCPPLGLAFHHRRVLSRLPAAAPACVGNRYMPVFPAAGTKVSLDGKVDEWPDAARLPLELHEYGDLTACVCVPGRTDSAGIMVMCDEETLYVLVRVLDDAVVNPRGAANRFAGDCVQLFLDLRAPDAAANPLSSGAYSDGVYHFYFAPPTADGQAAAFRQGPQKVRAAGPIQFAAAAAKDGYVIEAALPLASLLDPPVPGRFRQPFGCEVLVADVDAPAADGTPSPVLVYGWGGSEEAQYHGSPAAFNCASYLPARLPEIRAQVDTTPVTITADFARKLQPVWGFGGNLYYDKDPNPHTPDAVDGMYAWQKASTLYMADNVRYSCLRTNVHLFQWEWENDNDDPTTTDMKRFGGYTFSQGSTNRNVMELFSGPGPDSHGRYYKTVVDWYLILLKAWAKPGVRLCFYADTLPSWLAVEPADKRQSVIARAKWPEYAECLTSYLAYAKEVYGIEFAYFSLRDPRDGYPRIVEDDYPELLKFLGAEFARKGLRTKLLLSDTTRTYDFRWYGRLGQDQELRKYIGGIGLEVSGELGPQLPTLRLWGDLAAEAQQPLLLTCVGRPYSFSPTYLLEEVGQWQQLLRELQPAALIVRQFVSEKTNKWALVRAQQVVPDAERGWPVMAFPTLADRAADVLPTMRYWFVKQFCELTPTGWAVATTSDHPQVQVTGFVGEPLGSGGAGGGALTLHVTNAGARRTATVAGLPPAMQSLRLVWSGTGAGGRDGGEVRAVNGKATLLLPPWSLVTLTTLPAAK